MNFGILKGVGGFEWDKANISHIAVHDVTYEEAEDVFFDHKNVFKHDLKHSTVEKRFILIGKTQKKRLLYLIFTKRKNKIRVISARDINRREVKLYEEKINHS